MCLGSRVRHTHKAQAHDSTRVKPSPSQQQTQLKDKKATLNKLHDNEEKVSEPLKGTEGKFLKIEINNKQTNK